MTGPWFSARLSKILSPPMPMPSKPRLPGSFVWGLCGNSIPDTDARCVPNSMNFQLLGWALEALSDLIPASPQPHLWLPQVCLQFWHSKLCSVPQTHVLFPHASLILNKECFCKECPSSPQLRTPRHRSKYCWTATSFRKPAKMCKVAETLLTRW